MGTNKHPIESSRKIDQSDPFLPTNVLANKTVISFLSLLNKNVMKYGNKLETSCLKFGCILNICYLHSDFLSHASECKTRKYFSYWSVLSTSKGRLDIYTCFRPSKFLKQYFLYLMVKFITEAWFQEGDVK